MEGRQVDAAALSDKIDAALHELNARRLAQAVEKLACSIEIVCRAIEADEITDELEDEFDDLCRVARDIADIGGPDIRKLCKPLLKVLHTIRADIDEIDLKQAELLQPLSSTIVLAAGRMLSRDRVRDEIDRTLASIASEAHPNEAVAEAAPAATWVLSR